MTLYSVSDPLPFPTHTTHHQSVFRIKHTPCRTQCETCSVVAKSDSNTKPTPIWLRRSEVVYTGVLNVFWECVKQDSKQNCYNNILQLISCSLTGCFISKAANQPFVWVNTVRIHN